MSRWFRVYDDLVDDPKVQRLRPDLFRALINLWCLASQNGGDLPPLDAIAFKLRLKTDRAERMLSELRDAGLIDFDETGRRPHNWNARQFKSDVSTPRVKRFREQRGNVSLAVSETPPETEADTETEQKEEKATSLRSVAKKPRERGTRLSEDWAPSIEGSDFACRLLGKQGAFEEVPKFRDYWHARAGPLAVKLDWDATWRTWCRKAAETKNGGSNGKHGKPNTSDLAYDLARQARERELEAGIGRPIDALRGH